MYTFARLKYHNSYHASQHRLLQIGAVCSEGRWTIQAAMDLNVPAPIITLSLFERFHSRQPESFAAKVLAAMRAGFGGHAVKKAQ